MPRILQVVLSLNPGGTERLVMELARRLHPSMPTAVCCLDNAGAWAGELERVGISVTALNRRPGLHPSLGGRVAAVARAHGATVIHAHHYSPFVYSALARLRMPGLPVIYTEHGRLSDAGPSSKRRVVNLLLRHFANDVYTVSDDVRQHLVAEGFRRETVGVIYNGIEIGASPIPDTRARVRRELGVSDGTFVVGTIARLDPVKNLNTLVDAIGILSAEPAEVLLVVIGDGPERGSLERQVAERGLEDGIRFLGHRDDARDWLAGCDVYANSSISEGVSLTILEGMAAGLPVVATAVGGTPEVVDDTCGRLVPARDASALADALRALGDDADLRRTLGQVARARVEQRFTLERMVGEYEGIYRGSS